MARGQSGRLIVDIDPELKKQFHAALTIDGTTYKDWALARIADYLENRSQPSLPGLSSGKYQALDLQAAEAPAHYNPKQDSSKS